MLPLFAAAAVATTTATTYHLDAAKSALTIHVFKAGVASPALHDHDFHPSTWSATVRFDPADPATAHVELSIDAASLHDSNPELSAADETKVDDEAHTTILDAAQFPTISVTADRFTVATTGSAGSWTGTLPATITMHGVSKPVDVPLTLARDGDALHATGEVDVLQSDFGIKPFRKALGTIRIKDRLHVRFDVRAEPDR